MIKWEEKYKTGVQEIDHQHEWLFEFVNDLEEQLLEKKDVPSVDHILDSLNDYAKIHFHFEEACMNKWKCPFAKENKCAHHNFVKVYDNFMERYGREGHSEELAWKIHDMTERWIINHICKVDVKLKSYLKIDNKDRRVKSILI